MERERRMHSPPARSFYALGVGTQSPLLRFGPSPIHAPTPVVRTGIALAENAVSLESPAFLFTGSHLSWCSRDDAAERLVSQSPAPRLRSTRAVLVGFGVHLVARTTPRAAGSCHVCS